MVNARGVINSRSVAVFISGCAMVFLFTGSFKANTVFVDEAISVYKANYFLVGSAYVLQPAVGFMVAGAGGSLLEDISFRAMGVIGGVLFGAGFIYQGLFGYHLYQLFVSMSITAIGGGLLHFALFISYLEHFRDKFSVAFSARELCTYIGIATMPPFVEMLRSAFGLHGAVILLGGISCNCILCGLLLKPPIDAPKRDRRDQTCMGNCCCCFGSEDVGNSDEVNGRGHRSLLQNVFDLSPVTEHRPFAVFITLHSLFYYTFTAWAIFLVPFGTALGLIPSDAVYLSTVGGVGGFLGKILAIGVFHFDKMDPISAGMVPSLVICVGLSGYLLTDMYSLLMLSSFLCGLGLAYADSAQNGVLPRYLCKYHLRQGSAISYFGGGVFMQLGGCVSGFIIDHTSSYHWMFGVMVVVNAAICILSVVLYRMDTDVPECVEDPGEEAAAASCSYEAY